MQMHLQRRGGVVTSKEISDLDGIAKMLDLLMEQETALRVRQIRTKFQDLAGDYMDLAGGNLRAPDPPEDTTMAARVIVAFVVGLMAGIVFTVSVRGVWW
jgi:hypothetical protein